MKVACAYIRVSTDMQLEYSPESQLKLIKQYAYKNNFVLNELIYKDEGISGRNAEKRPSFNKMLSDAKLGLFNTILIYNTSRFARNHEESILYRAMLKRHNVDVISITQPNIDPKTDLLMNALYSVMDERYSIELSENVKRGMMEKVSRGKYISCPPFGYEKKYKNATISVVYEEAKFVSYLFNEYLNTNKSMYELSQELNLIDIKTKRGNQFHSKSIYNLLTNSVYKGFVKWTCDENTLFLKADHDAIISEKLFDEVQNKINSIKKHNNYKKKNLISYSHWLIGLIRCEECNSTFVYAKGYKNRADRFRCGGYCRGLCTNNISIKVNDIEDLILNFFKNIGIQEIQFKKISYENIDLIKEIDRSIKKLHNKLERSKQAYLSGVDNLEEYSYIKSETLNSISILEKKLIDIENYKKNEKNITILEFLQIETNLNINTFLKSLIKSIYFDKKKKKLNIILNH